MDGSNGQFAIDLHHVEKIYKGKVHALRGIEMRVHHGEIFGLLGPNGAGKTTLVKALTGVDTDRLPEEKKRGITIELGFAELTLGEVRLGIVDVPGHERFVRSMLAGATGIEVLDERRTQLAAEIARQQRDRQAARERAAAVAVLRRIRDEMTALPQRVFTWARRGQFAAAFGHLDALLKDEHYRAHHDRIRMIRRDMDGIVRFRRRAQENLAALIGSEYTLRTVHKQTWTGQIVKVAGGKVWLRLTVSKTDPPISDAQTTVRLDDLTLQTWLILGAQHQPDEDTAPFARANADAGLFLLSYSLNARARRYFRAAATGITPAERKHYQELAEDLK